MHTHTHIHTHTHMHTRMHTRMHTCTHTHTHTHTHAQLVLPHDTTILDASSSTDDGGSKALTFHWEEVQGPIRNSALVSDTAMLRLHDLKQGKYRYKLVPLLSFPLLPPFSSLPLSLRSLKCPRPTPSHLHFQNSALVSEIAVLYKTLNKVNITTS